MWKALLHGRRRIVATSRRIVDAAREWSRPVRVAGCAIVDVRKTKAELIAEKKALDFDTPANVFNQLLQ